MSASDLMLLSNDLTRVVSGLWDLKQDAARYPHDPFFQLDDPLVPQSRGASLCSYLMNATKENNRSKMILLFGCQRASYITQNMRPARGKGFRFLQELVPIFENNLGGVRELLEDFLTPKHLYNNMVDVNELNDVITKVLDVHHIYQQHKEIGAAVAVQQSRAPSRKPHKM